MATKRTKATKNKKTEKPKIKTADLKPAKDPKGGFQEVDPRYKRGTGI